MRNAMTTHIEDKFAIEERIGIYNLAIDQGHYDELLACWCEDGVLDGLGGPHVGHAAIRAFTDDYELRFRKRLNGLKHFTVNIVSTVQGDRATSSSHLQLVSTGTKGSHTLFTGRYEDELRRVGGQWLFSRRKLHQDMPLPSTTADAV